MNLSRSCWFHVRERFAIAWQAKAGVICPAAAPRLEKVENAGVWTSDKPSQQLRRMGCCCSNMITRACLQWVLPLLWVQKRVGTTSLLSPGKAESLVRPVERLSFHSTKQHHAVHYAYDHVLLTGDKSSQPPWLPQRFHCNYIYVSIYCDVLSCRF